VKIALNTADTDLIIGGHSHTFMDSPEVYFNRRGNQVLINQVGWAGLLLGRIDLTFEKNKKNKCVTCENIWLEENF
jgi:5'-nucleotidase